jgi:hypothetical protein
MAQPHAEEGARNIYIGHANIHARPCQRGGRDAIDLRWRSEEGLAGT